MSPDLSDVVINCAVSLEAQEVSAHGIANVRVVWTLLQGEV